MKVVLFCGGLGTRIREYSESIPKPMVPIGHQPILWHVMQYYSQYNHNDFILCLGYKANVIKDYFLNYRATANSDCVISEYGKKVELIGEHQPDWRVSLRAAVARVPAFITLLWTCTSSEPTICSRYRLKPLGDR